MTTRTRARQAEQLHLAASSAVNEAVTGFFSPAQVKVRKWLKAPVKFGQIKLMKWQPETDRTNPELQDLRQGIDQKAVKPKRPRPTSRSNRNREKQVLYIFILVLV